jgi:predicted GNAT family N-acyltransferase
MGCEQPPIVVSITDPHMLARVFSLRAETWEPIFPHATTESWVDQHDLQAEHLGVVEGEDVIAAARLNLHSTSDAAARGFRGVDCAEVLPILSTLPTPIAYMSRLVVHRQHQGRGLGTLVLDSLVRRAISLRPGSIVCLASFAHVAVMLRRCGFRDGPTIGLRAGGSIRQGQILYRILTQIETDWL